MGRSRHSAGFTVDHYNDLPRRRRFARPIVPGTTFTDNHRHPDPRGRQRTPTRSSPSISSTAGPGIASAPVGVIYDTTAPGAPGGVSATAALDGSVGISWTASADGAGSGIASYVVRRSSSSSAPATIADGDATCQVTATSCADATALNGKLYSYAVFAVDRAGNTSLAGVVASR